MAVKTALPAPPVARRTEVSETRSSGTRRTAARRAAYERLLNLPEEREELSEEGVRALQEGIDDFKAGRTFTREEIEREFGA
ncbi:MAG: hypothetical protein OXH05_00345 [Acidobacteria bacterium]|nr:hypothetical protein [Acidobacteriota bacterium]